MSSGLMKLRNKAACSASNYRKSRFHWENICTTEILSPFGHTKLEAIHVPGHSPGSLVYYCKEDNCMFSGDVLFQGSIGRADLSGGNFDELIDHNLQPSIRTS